MKHRIIALQKDDAVSEKPESLLLINRNRHRFKFDPSALSVVSSRSKNVSQVISDALIAGNWLPGDRINDLELSTMLHVSRISVRQALSSLVERKIVEQIHWKGYYVRKLSLEEVRSIIEVRVALEKLAVTKLLTRRDPSIFTEMRASIKRSTQALNANEYAMYMRTDFEFHELLYKGSGNLWIKNIIEDLRLQINVLRNLSMAVNFKIAGLASTRDHSRILRQLEAGNKRGAIRLLNEHFDTHFKNIKEEYHSLYRAKE